MERNTNSCGRVAFPKLDSIKGSANATSTTNISDFCTFFDNLKRQKKILGKELCTSNNANANTGDGSGGQSNSDRTDAAAGVGVNMAMLVLAVGAGIAQIL